MLRDIFLVFRAQVLGVYPDIEVGLQVDDEAGERSSRACAYCAEVADKEYMIGVAPHMLKAPWTRVEGVLAHEFGHVLLLAGGDVDHTERAADQAAEALFDVQISYDANDIQTTGPGIRPRPAYLDDENGRTC